MDSFEIVAVVDISPLLQVVIAAPSIHLQTCKQLLRPEIAVSSQDVGFKTGYGAFTGELSAEMLRDSGINWTLTGHSERRVGFGFPVSDSPRTTRFC